MVDDRDASLSRRTHPKQARARKSVQRILSTTATLLDEVGMEGLTTNLIAERANVRVRTVYRYFPNKLAIVVTLFEEQTQAGDAKLMAGVGRLADPETPWREVIDDTIESFFGAMMRTPGWKATRRAMRSCPELVDVNRTALNRQAGELAKSIGARGIEVSQRQRELIGRAVLDTGAIFVDLALEGRFPRGEVVTELKRMVIRYLAPYLDEPS